MVKNLLILAILTTFTFALIGQKPIVELTPTPSHHDISDCPDLLTLSGPIVKDFYQAIDIHLTDIVLFPIIDVRFVSQTQVDLNSEIEVPNGSTLTVSISDCPDATKEPDHHNRKKEDQVVKKE